MRKMNDIGKIIEIKPILNKHQNEMGCATSSNVCRYLDCNKGEVYVVFDDKENIHHGVLCKIKSDACLGFSLAAFSAKDDVKERQEEYWKNVGYDGNAIIYLGNYRYMMRLS